jgi:hypothetical protein
MIKTYQVLAPCVVHIPVSSDRGPSLATFYQHATFRGEEDTVKIRHLVESDMIVELDKNGQPVNAETAPAEDDQPAAPKTVNARSTKGELVAYAVSQGMAADEAAQLTAKELQARYVNTDPAE